MAKASAEQCRLLGLVSAVQSFAQFAQDRSVPERPFQDLQWDMLERAYQPDTYAQREYMMNNIRVGAQDAYRGIDQLGLTNAHQAGLLKGNIAVGAMNSLGAAAYQDNRERKALERAGYMAKHAELEKRSGQRYYDEQLRLRNYNQLASNLGDIYTNHTRGLGQLSANDAATRIQLSNMANANTNQAIAGLGSAATTLAYGYMNAAKTTPTTTDAATPQEQRPELQPLDPAPQNMRQYQPPRASLPPMQRPELQPLAPAPDSFSRQERNVDRSVPVPEPNLNNMASLVARRMMSSMLSPTL